MEFRLWDGSLEPGRIQAQVKMSTAMLDYTTRNRDLVFPADERTPAGTLNPDRPEFAEDTRQIRGHRPGSTRPRRRGPVLVGVGAGDPQLHRYWS